MVPETVPAVCDHFLGSLARLIVRGHDEAVGEMLSGAAGSQLEPLKLNDQLSFLSQ